MKLNIVKYRILCLCISAALLIPCICAMIYSSIVTPTHSPLKVGIDYTGGTILQYGVNEKNIAPERLGELRIELNKAGVKNPEIQIIDVNKNTHIIVTMILPNRFGVFIFAIDVVIVKKMSGTMITNKRFKNKSPKGLSIVAFSWNIIPTIAPTIIATKRIIVDL